MTVSDIKDLICREIGFSYEHKIISLIHRVKNDLNPSEKILKYLDNNFVISSDLKVKISEIDFFKLSKSKHGGRGADKKTRTKKQVKKIEEAHYFDESLNGIEIFS